LPDSSVRRTASLLNSASYRRRCNFSTGHLLGYKIPFSRCPSNQVSCKSGKLQRRERGI
jgi:hypothetical protein